MVGAQKGNRCDTCRKRKIKCDESWPICGQCKRGNRLCPPRPALKVVDDGPKVRSTIRNKTTLAAGHMEKGDPVAPCGILAGINRHVNAHIDSPTPLTPSERLTFDFINSLQAENQSYSLNVLGEFMWEIPRHLGRSEALDIATACMIASRKQHLLSDNQDWQIHPQLYSRALRSIRRALVDPSSWSSSDTLCATILMHRLEAIFGIFPSANSNVHAAGLAALQERRGPPTPGDKLEIQTTVDSHISIIQHSLYERKDCFLANPEWAAVLDEPNGRSDTQMIYYRLIRLMTLWPRLALENGRLMQGDGTINPDSTLEGGIHILKELSRIGNDVKELIKSGKLISIKPSAKKGDIVPVMFQIKSKLVALLVCHYAMYSIIVHQIVLSQLQVIGDERQDRKILKMELMRQCRHIWMLLDYSRAHKPLGLPIMPPALMFTLDFAEDSDAQEAIVEAMNELDSVRYQRGYWSAEQARQDVKVFLGLF